MASPLAWLRSLRHPLATLAAFFLVANLALPGAAQAAGWNVVCSGLHVVLLEGETPPLPDCPWCIGDAPRPLALVDSPGERFERALLPAPYAPVLRSTAGDRPPRLRGPPAAI